MSIFDAIKKMKEKEAHATQKWHYMTKITSMDQDENDSSRLKEWKTAFMRGVGPMPHQPRE
eukprot:CAMPEP_0114545832 /NCGR_PEP_ID=MMETSP0114-20121206/3620_1 /TAXON_ID=31324 /ORGANISM="Goniomonas sp, Strain m" /LENGTH=60 /DNA_ID=CAMNT_0001730305 /DNA_START=46 /DNA_END=228 /DNA_ORIENTATION=+